MKEGVDFAYIISKKSDSLSVFLTSGSLEKIDPESNLVSYFLLIVAGSTEARRGDPQPSALSGGSDVRIRLFDFEKRDTD
jgi:hypothetical protein